MGIGNPKMIIFTEAPRFFREPGCGARVKRWPKAYVPHCPSPWPERGNPVENLRLFQNEAERAADGELTKYLPVLWSVLPSIVIALAVATGARYVARRALEATHFGHRVGAALVSSLANLLYWLVLLLFLPGVLKSLGLLRMFQPVQSAYDEAFALLPNLLIAGVICVLGYLTARIVRPLATRFFIVAGADATAPDAPRKANVSAALGTAVLAAVLIPILGSAFSAFTSDAAARPETLPETLARLFPNIIAAVLIVTVGYFIARSVQQLLIQTLPMINADAWTERVPLPESLQNSSLFSSIAFNLIFIFSLLLALNVLKLDFVSNPISELFEKVLFAIPVAIVATLGVAFLQGIFRKYGRT
jgi:hypothetical protein